MIELRTDNSAGAETIRRAFPQVEAVLAPACHGGEPLQLRDGMGDHVECRACGLGMPAGYERVPECTFRALCPSRQARGSGLKGDENHGQRYGP